MSKHSLFGRNGAWILLGLVLAIACAAPLLLGTYAQRVVTTAFMYLALAQAWNLIGGYAGLMSIAVPAFFGISAIVTGVMTLNGLNPVLSASAGVACASVLALLIGLPTLRLQGHYFVAATLLVSEALRNLVLNVNAFGFSGGTSMNLVNSTALGELNPQQFNLFFYFMMLGIAAASMVLIHLFEGSRSGFALRAIRDNQRAAGALGVDVARQKMTAFLLSAAMTAVVGAIWAFWLGVVETNEAFSLRVVFDVIVIVFLGGRATLWGPVAGTAMIIAVNETIGVEFPEVHLIMSGTLVALVVLFLPDGLIGALKDGPRAFAPRRLLANLRRNRIV